MKNNLVTKITCGFMLFSLLLLMSCISTDLVKREIDVDPPSQVFFDADDMEGSPPSTLDVENVWKNKVTVGDRKIQVIVWAGQVKTDQQSNSNLENRQGSIFIEVSGSDPWNLQQTQFETVEESGPLTIAEASIKDGQFQIYLETEDAIKYRFDSKDQNLKIVN